jgi:hypothetical protein
MNRLSRTKHDYISTNRIRVVCGVICWKVGGNGVYRRLRVGSFYIDTNLTKLNESDCHDEFDQWRSCHVMSQPVCDSIWKVQRFIELFASRMVGDRCPGLSDKLIVWDNRAMLRVFLIGLSRSSRLLLLLSFNNGWCRDSPELVVFSRKVVSRAMDGFEIDWIRRKCVSGM